MPIASSIFPIVAALDSVLKAFFNGPNAFATETPNRTVATGVPAPPVTYTRAAFSRNDAPMFATVNDVFLRMESPQKFAAPVGVIAFRYQGLSCSISVRKFGNSFSNASVAFCSCAK